MNDALLLNIKFLDGRGIAGSNSDGANGRGGGDSGKVAGGVIGGLLCLVLLSAIVIVCLWFGRRKIAERQAFKGKLLLCIACKDNTAKPS